MARRRRRFRRSTPPNGSAFDAELALFLVFAAVIAWIALRSAGLLA